MAAITSPKTVQRNETSFTTFPPPLFSKSSPFFQMVIPAICGHARPKTGKGLHGKTIRNRLGVEVEVDLLTWFEGTDPKFAPKDNSAVLMSYTFQKGQKKGPQPSLQSEGFEPAPRPNDRQRLPSVVSLL
ncbi:MAG TPA: hypothetical protein GX393_06295 [Firmicutes bacterium]|nr:hypothetical protein [Bacillota bacterium]